MQAALFIRDLARTAGRLALLTLLATGVPAAAQTVARVNGAPIDNAQLDRAFHAVLAERKLNLTRMRNPAQARDLKRVALERLIQEELFWQQAQKENLVVGEAEVEKAFAESMASFRSREAFETQLMRQGTDERGFRDSIHRLQSADRYAQRVVEQRVRITDADIEAFYRANPSLFAQPERWKVRTMAILAPSTQPPDERLRARLRLEALRLQLTQGSDFDRLARQHSDDPTRQWGGALDPAPLAELPEWMRAPLAKLKPGELSPVIETTQGYHLLKLEARLPASRVPLAQARPAIRDQLQKTRGAEALDQATAELRAAAKIELLVPL